MKKIFFVLCTLMCGAAMFAQVATTNDTVNVVYVNYNGNSATVTACSNIASYITATVSGGKVSIIQSANVSATTCGEIIYDLSGSSDNGSFYLEGYYKSTVALRGLTLTNPSGPALDIQNGKRIEVSVKRGTVNTLTDGTSSVADAWKGCYQCKGHTEFKGYGVLNVYANYAHAIWSKEYITVKNCTINVYSAVKDAINCNQYFSMESGEVNLSGFGDDAIQVSLKVDDTSAENTGNFTLNGGTINIDMQGATGSSVKAAGTAATATGATLNVKNGTALKNINELAGKVAIFNILGQQIGIYNDLQTATLNLDRGSYIVLQNNKTSKIIIR